MQIFIKGNENEKQEILYIFDAHPKVCELLTGKTLLFKWDPCRVELDIGLLQCSQCKRFGHTKNKCKAAGESCARCGKDHKRSECNPHNILCCVNCYNHNRFMRSKEISYDEYYTNHSPFDRYKCLVYQNALEREIRRLCIEDD